LTNSETFVTASRDEAIATVTLSRGKVNALNLAVVQQLHGILTQLERDDDVRTVVLTGRGPFFSFGFDIPEFIEAGRDEFSEYLVRFAGLYRYLFTYPKPVIAALNGHAIGGGCMLALACDQRLMVRGKARISLNEITFGSTVFAGSTEMLRFAAGDRNATTILYSGALLSAAEAAGLGLVDVAVLPDEFGEAVHATAKMFAAKPLSAFTSLKLLLRRPVAEAFAARERASIAEFIEIWHSPATRELLRLITIRQ
jgi:enoyl-CoA hydratase/carnithine racemase